MSRRWSRRRQTDHLELRTTRAEMLVQLGGVGSQSSEHVTSIDGREQTTNAKRPIPPELLHHVRHVSCWTRTKKITTISEKGRKWTVLDDNSWIICDSVPVCVAVDRSRPCTSTELLAFTAHKPKVFHLSRQTQHNKASSMNLLLSSCRSITKCQ